jgi:hypothetical protein
MLRIMGQRISGPRIGAAFKYSSVYDLKAKLNWLLKSAWSWGCESTNW